MNIYKNQKTFKMKFKKKINKFFRQLQILTNLNIINFTKDQFQ